MTKVISKLFALILLLSASTSLAFGASEFRAYASSTVDAKCVQSTDGSANVIINGGEKFTTAAPYSASLLRNNESYIAVMTYSEELSGTKLQLDGLKAGYYFITISDKNGETATASFTIESPAAIITTIATTTDIMCAGDSTGKATLVITGGKQPYVVTCTDIEKGEEAGAISIINSNVSIVKLYKGNFSLEITDANGCSPELPVVFTINSTFDAIAYNPVSNDISCFGEATGKIFGEAQGGKLPFQYTITNTTSPYTAGNSTGTFTGLPVGNYTATVTDANGCTKTVTDVIVGTPEDIKVKEPEQKPAATVVCENDKTASIKFTVTGRTEFVPATDTASYYSVKLYSITDQHEVAITDFKTSNKMHPVFREPRYCEKQETYTDAQGNEHKKTVTYLCGMDTLFDKGCHEPSLDYPQEKLGFDCDDYITVSGLGKGAYRIEFYRGACILGDFMEFTVEQTGGVPQVVKINALDPICDGESRTITPEIESNPGATAYRWSLGGINVATTKAFSHTYKSAEDKRILQLEVTNACGSTISNETQISVVPRPTAKLSAENPFLCEGQSTVITMEFKGTAPFIYTLPGGDESSTFNAVEKETVTPDRSLTYTLTSLQDANCNAIIETDVTPTYVEIFPEQDIELDITVPDPMVNGRDVKIVATPGFVSYSLEMNGVQYYAKEKSNEFKIRQFPYGTTTNQFTVTVLDKNGCYWDADASAVVTSKIFPNIFTPNEDGVNDIFLKDYNIEVFDRWGTVIYTGTDGWDGKHNGSYVNPGVYLYIVKVIDENNNEVVIKSTVTVER